MYVKQISVFMENRPGRLAEITKVLSDNGIDIRAINIADTTDFGILRMIVNDEVKAEQVLRSNDMTANVSNVIAISIDDSVGAFSRVIELLRIRTSVLSTSIPLSARSPARRLLC